ncbi:putative ATP-grasp-modified RiPP [Streptomyces sp. NPDC054765]
MHQGATSSRPWALQHFTTVPPRASQLAPDSSYDPGRQITVTADGHPAPQVGESTEVTTRGMHPGDVEWTVTSLW